MRSRTALAWKLATARQAPDARSHTGPSPEATPALRPTHLSARHTNNTLSIIRTSPPHRSAESTLVYSHSPRLRCALTHPWKDSYAPPHRPMSAGKRLKNGRHASSHYIGSHIDPGWPGAVCHLPRGFSAAFSACLREWRNAANGPSSPTITSDVPAASTSANCSLVISCAYWKATMWLPLKSRCTPTLEASLAAFAACAQ